MRQDAELEPHDWLPPSNGLPWPSTRTMDPWIRLCAVHGRAFGFDHGQRVRELLRRLVDRALGR